MNEFIEVTINNEVYKFRKGISLEEISKSFQSICKYPIILARIDNSLKELNYIVNKNCRIFRFDIT